MAFTIPTRESLHSDFISDYAASQPTKSVSRGSIPFILGRVVSGILWSAVARLLFFDKQRLPDTSEKAFLDRWGAVYGFPRQGPAGSTGAAALRVSGTVGAAVTTGAVLAHADGTLYQVTTVGAAIGAGGTVDVDISATSKGLATNKVIGEVLTFQAPPLNVTATATLGKNLANGVDNETDDAYRVRLMAHIGDPPEGGALHDYQEWAKQVPGVASAYVYKARRGTGTIDVAVLASGSGTARIVTDVAAVQDYLDDITRRPGNVKDVLVLSTTAQTQDVDVSVSIDTTLFKWDWDDLGIGYTVTATDGSTTITVPTAPAAVVAGVRITVNGEEAKVTARAGNILTVAPTAGGWFVSNPVGTLNMHASGDLVVPVRTAISALFDRLGPARNAYAATTWESDLLTDSVITAVRNVYGVTKAVINTPAADVTPVDALGTTTSVPFLVAGKITVRKR